MLARKIPPRLHCGRRPATADDRQHSRSDRLAKTDGYIRQRQARTSHQPRQAPCNTLLAIKMAAAQHRPPIHAHCVAPTMPHLLCAAAAHLPAVNPTHLPAVEPEHACSARLSAHCCGRPRRHAMLSLPCSKRHLPMACSCDQLAHQLARGCWVAVVRKDKAALRAAALWSSQCILVHDAHQRVHIHIERVAAQAGKTTRHGGVSVSSGWRPQRRVCLCASCTQCCGRARTRAGVTCTPLPWRTARG